MAKQKDMIEEGLASFAPENSPGMRARLEAMKQHRNGKPLVEVAGRDGVLRPSYEAPDPTPMAPPVGYRPGPSLIEQIRQMVRSEHVRFAADQAGVDTFEEADDFEVEADEDYDPTSPYEAHFEPLPRGELSRRRQEEFVKNEEAKRSQELEAKKDRSGEIQSGQGSSQQGVQPISEKSGGEGA